MSLLDALKSKAGQSTATATVTTTPATTPAPQRQLRLKGDNSFPWRRLSISITGIFINLFVWRWSVNHLYTLPPTSISVYGSITIATMYANTFIVAYFITGQAYFTNWSNVSTANIVSDVKSYFESKKSTEKKINKTKK